MSVKEVPMWRVECDKCGKDDGGEYYAWADHGQAQDQWDSYDHFVLSDGRAFHYDCLPPEFCPLGDGDDLAHTPDEADPSMCVECEKPIPGKVAV